MSLSQIPPQPSSPAERWRLWIDGCGGFLVLSGECWSVGGSDDSTAVDIAVQADWPRRAGWLQRRDDDYFWFSGSAATKRLGADRSPQPPRLIASGQTLPIPGSAVMRLSKPSPLCGSALLSVTTTHRFADHVDGVLLLDKSFLVGPTSDCHIRSSQLADRVVLTHHEQGWKAKVGMRGDFQDILPGKRVTFPMLPMTLEEA